MNKTELVAAVAEKAGMTKKDAERVVNATIDTIVQNLANGEKVQISGFGSFESKERAARIGRNPHTHEEMEIPAFKSAGFSPSRTLKSAINK